MTRAARPTLALYALRWLLAATHVTAGSMAVHSPTKVTGLMGHSVILLCSIDSEELVKVTQVTWMKERAGESSSVAVYHHTRGPHIPEPERFHFVFNQTSDILRNGSLVLDDLRVEDEGYYTCQLATFPKPVENTHVWLQVLAQSKNTIEATPVPVTSEMVQVAHCISKGGHPPARVTWLSDLNGTVSEKQNPGPWPRTVTTHSFYNLPPSRLLHGKNVTCKVEQEGLEKPDLLSVTLNILYPPVVTISGYDGNWYVGRPEVELTCNVDSNPAALNVTWDILNTSIARPEGNRLVFPTVDWSMNRTFTCWVSNQVGTGEGKETILVSEQPLEAQFGIPSIIAFIIIALLVAVFVGILIYCKKFRHRDDPPSSPHTLPVPVNDIKDPNSKLGAVAHTCLPSTQEAECEATVGYTGRPPSQKNFRKNPNSSPCRRQQPKPEANGAVKYSAVSDQVSCPHDTTMSRERGGAHEVEGFVAGLHLDA